MPKAEYEDQLRDVEKLATGLFPTNPKIRLDAVNFLQDIITSVCGYPPVRGTRNQPAKPGRPGPTREQQLKAIAIAIAMDKHNHAVMATVGADRSQEFASAIPPGVAENILKAAAAMPDPTEESPVDESEITG